MRTSFKIFCLFCFKINPDGSCIGSRIGRELSYLKPIFPDFSSALRISFYESLFAQRKWKYIFTNKRNDMRFPLFFPFQYFLGAVFSLAKAGEKEIWLSTIHSPIHLNPKSIPHVSCIKPSAIYVILFLIFLLFFFFFSRFNWAPVYSLFSTLLLVEVLDCGIRLLLIKNTNHFYWLHSNSNEILARPNLLAAS